MTTFHRRHSPVHSIYLIHWHFLSTHYNTFWDGPIIGIFPVYPCLFIALLLRHPASVSLHPLRCPYVLMSFTSICIGTRRPRSRWANNNLFSKKTIQTNGQRQGDFSFFSLTFLTPLSSLVNILSLLLTAAGESSSTPCFPANTPRLPILAAASCFSFFRLSTKGETLVRRHTNFSSLHCRPCVDVWGRSTFDFYYYPKIKVPMLLLHPVKSQDCP